MFNANYYPTPEHLFETIVQGETLTGKKVFEPSAGGGHMVTYCQRAGAEVVASETDAELRKILATKCHIIANDFLTVTADMVSHIDYIIMNPPFSADERHILHAYNIAPAGCKIRALCNLNTVKHTEGYQARRELKALLSTQGGYLDLGQAFTTAERKTNVEVALVMLQKPGAGYETEFEGFFMEEEPGQEEGATAGLMSYNVIRDLVHRYIEAVKIYDDQLNTAVKLNGVIAPFHNESLGFQCTKEGYQQNRGQFKKDLQKSAWAHIFNKLDMGRIATQGLKADINKFVENQNAVPFTMKNIYRMLEIVIGTTGQRMDKAILEVFDRLTEHHHENRHKVEGWKTNSHYLLGQKFILPRMCQVDKYHTGESLCNVYGGYFPLVEDLLKAMCYLTGDNYDHKLSLDVHIRNRYKIKNKTTGAYVQGYYNVFTDLDRAKQRLAELNTDGDRYEIEDSPVTYGNLFDWGYFQVRAYKKGTMHFQFKDPELWARLNQRIAKLKGYPLFEHTSRERKAREQHERAQAQAKNPTPQGNAHTGGTGKVLYTFKAKN